MGSESEGIEVLSCDYDNNRATVKIHGETRVLYLRKAVTSKGTFSPGTGKAATVAQNRPQVDGPGGPPPDGGEPGGPPDMPPGPVDASKIKAPVTREEKETEARMLVSDMLDISMRQRKAYEAAKKKAAEEAKAAQ